MLDLLLTLNGGSKTFNELKNLNMSPNTVLARLRNAQTNGWVKDELVRHKDTKSKIAYSLTKEGESAVLKYHFILPQYNELRKELKNLQRKVKEKEKKVRYILSSVKVGKSKTGQQ